MQLDTRSDAGVVRESVWVADAGQWVGPPGTSGGVPFHSFSLGAGQERWVVFSERFQGCDRHSEFGSVQKGATAFQSLARAEVTYKVFGLIPLRRVLPYDVQQQVILDSSSSCPGYG